MRFNPERVANFGKRLAYCTYFAALGHLGAFIGPVLNNPLRENEVAHGIFVDKIRDEDAYFIRHELRMTKDQSLEAVLDKAYASIHSRNPDCALYPPYNITGQRLVNEVPDQDVYIVALVCPSRIAE